MDMSKGFATLFGIIVFVGAMTMIVKNPSGANTLVASGASGISTITKGLEGR